MVSAEVSDIPSIVEHAPIPTWFGVGGGADRFARPESVPQLRACLDLDPALKILGDGANLLVDDDGVGELVVSLASAAFTFMQIDQSSGRVRVGAGVKLPALINKTVELGLEGLETLAGFPATMGGAAVMNAGGKYGEISRFITRVGALDRTGRHVTLERDAIGFSYRRSGLNDLLITDIELQLTRGDAAALRARKIEVMEYKKRTQPLAENSAGCCFKNPTLPSVLRVPVPAESGEGRAGAFEEFAAGSRVSAGMLIDRAGCKGLRIGSAEVSPQHGNFITAEKSASGGRARDVIALIREVARRVHDRFGVTLETEVVIWSRT